MALLRQALIRLRTKEDLYFEDEHAVAFLTPNLFRVAIPVPATAPPGAYEVEIALLSDSVVLARAQTSFQLVGIGFEQPMANLCAIGLWSTASSPPRLALLFGWLASVIFRRD